MKVTTKDALISTLKEAGRIAFLAAASAVATFGYAELANVPTDTTLGIVLTVILRLADKFIHKNEAIEGNGLVPF